MDKIKYVTTGQKSQRKFRHCRSANYISKYRDSLLCLFLKLRCNLAMAIHVDSLALIELTTEML
jgi:hypothetical protein